MPRSGRNEPALRQRIWSQQLSSSAYVNLVIM